MKLAAPTLSQGSQPLPDGSVSYRGYVVAAGPSQRHDLARLANGDPAIDYPILMRGGRLPTTPPGLSVDEAVRFHWPDHPWSLPGGMHGVIVQSPGWRPESLPGPDPADWVPSADAPPPPAPPSLARQALNFAGAVARHVAHGMPTVDDAEKARRLAICRECEHFDAGRCRLCGCFMAIKSAMALEKCPHDPPKW
jgi:hypothetical protein